MSVLQELTNYKNSDCQDCGLAQKRTQIVTHRGNPEAKVVGIGEAPGKFEDIEGLAFTGPAGKELRKTAEKVGLIVDEHFLLLNTVMCRPVAEDYDHKENRQPLIEEREACQPKLIHLVNTLKPRLIILFGVPAMRNCMPNGPKRIGLAVGRFFPPEEHIFECDADVYVMYHPSYVLRYRQASKKYILDFIRLKHYLMGINVIRNF